MKCRGPITLSMTRQGKLPKVPCGQCLHCRINKRDRWVTRCLLESQSRIIGQFWTLTFSDEGLSNLQARGARTLFANFSDALRKRELRAGNALPIRCFGVLEHGATFGRPHVHLLVWNHINSVLTSTARMPGLPRPKYTIGSWPHGHIDCAPLNLKSMRYVCKYVMDFETDDPLNTNRNITFHVRKPCLGYDGLVMHIENISRSPARNWEQPMNIAIDGKHWALDQTMQQHFSVLCKKYGVRHECDTLPKKEALRIARNMEEDTNPEHRQARQLKKEALLAASYDRGVLAREVRRYSVFNRAAGLALQR